jgi:hypothetical protein
MQVQRAVELEVQQEKGHGRSPKYVFLDCRRVQGMDSSASAEFRKLKRYDPDLSSTRNQSCLQMGLEQRTSFSFR